MASDKEVLARFWEVIQPVRDQQHRPSLREKAEQLKRTDGEGWAVGEMLTRACIMLDALEMNSH